MNSREKIKQIKKYMSFSEIADQTGVSVDNLKKIAGGAVTNPHPGTKLAIDKLYAEFLSTLPPTELEEHFNEVKAEVQAETHRADREQFATIRDALRVKQEHIQANADFAHQGYQNYKAEVHKRLESADMNDAYATACVQLFRSFPFRFFMNIPYYSKQDGSTDWRAMYSRVRSWYRRFHISVPIKIDMPLLILPDDYEAIPRYRKGSSDHDNPA